MVLMIGGISIGNLSACNTIDTNFKPTPFKQSRDSDNNSNDYSQDITIINPGPPSYHVDLLNDGLSSCVLKVNITDGDNKISNGGTIASVKIDLFAFEGTPGWVDMVDDGSIPEDIPYDDVWTYNLSCPYFQPPGQYYVGINATDNGSIPGPLWTNTYEDILNNISVKVNQYNRNMTLTPVESINLVEDGHDEYLELNDTVFYDPDMSDGNIYEHLTFMVWNGDSWEISYDGPDFTVSIAASEDGNVTFHPKPDMYTSPAGEDVNFKAMDMGGHWKIISINVKVAAVNDAPSWIWIDPAEPPIPEYIDVTEDIPRNITLEVKDPDLYDIFSYDATLYYYEDWYGTEHYYELYEIDVSEVEKNRINLTLEMGDEEVYYGEMYDLYLNISAHDGSETANTSIEVKITSVNEEPELYFFADYFLELELDLVATEDEMYNLTSLTFDNDTLDWFSYDFNIVKYPEHAVKSSYVETKINYTELGGPLPIFFFEPFEDYFEGLDEYDDYTILGFNTFLFTPDNNDVGNIVINFSVEDMEMAKDWMTVNITIENTNDAPYFVEADGTPITTGEMLDYTGPNNLTADTEYLNFTVEAHDDDMIHGTETLTFSANVSLIIDGVLTITPWGEAKANYSFFFPKYYVGTDIYKIQVTDWEGFEDWFFIKVEVAPKLPKIPTVPPEPQPPEKPVISSPVESENHTVETVITFIVDPTSPNASIYLYRWNPGDGSEPSDWLSLDDLPWTHIYSEAGEYIVTLSIKDPNGLINSTMQKINITGEDKPTKPDEENGKSDDLEINEYVLVSIAIVIVIIISLLVYFGLIRLGLLRSKKGEDIPQEESEPLPPQKPVPPPSEPTITEPFQCGNCGRIMGQESVCQECGWNKWKYTQ